MADRKYFDNSREPFSITVAGTKLYIITSSQDMSLVYKNTTSLSFDEFIHDLHVSFEMSPSGQNIMWEPSYGKLLRISNELHRAQLHPGEHLDDMTEELLLQIEQRLAWSHISMNRNVEEGAPAEKKTLSLYRLCAEVMIPAATNAFFGEALLRHDPQLIEKFLAFDEDSWMITYRYPSFLARKMHRAREMHTQTFTRAAVHLTSSEALTAIFLSSTNANGFKVCFWLLTYLLHQPDTLEAIRQEFQTVFTDGKIDIESLLKCKLFNAAFDETLRLTSGASSARTVIAPTQLGNKVLRQGTKLLMPYRQLHFQTEVFGPQIKEFRPQRFLGEKDLGRSSEYKPFGGGITYCSGRFIARREVLAFVAMVLRKYDIELAGEGQRLPRLDEKKPTLGVIGPIKVHIHPNHPPLINTNVSSYIYPPALNTSAQSTPSPPNSNSIIPLPYPLPISRSLNIISQHSQDIIHSHEHRI
ncbi:MAG: hypothetical protein Q9219_006794 [cf. Caloplaca sp. 3 TL-2023]